MPAGLRPEQLRGLDPPDWQTYTVSLTNVTLGTGGSVTGRYRKVGRHVDLMVTFVLGTGGSVTGVFTASLPFPVRAGTFATLLCVGVDATAADFGGWALLSDADDLFWANGMQGEGAWENTVPFTWAVSDRFVAYGSYEAAV